jgi:phytoene/squalene synthetase
MAQPGAARVAPAAAITRAASLQSYLTIRWLADGERRADAFALYAYFRWLDDMIDERLPNRERRLALVSRQRDLLKGTTSSGISPEEALLPSMLRGSDDDGLRLSLGSMLDVMEFDARRRGRTVSQGELDEYTRVLAVAVTEALHHCIGHGCRSPHDETRYVAVTGAHVAHMLRDMVEDLAAGFVNVPADLLGVPPGGDAPTAGPHTADLLAAVLHAPEMRAWVRDRVGLARSCFATGRRYLERVESPRCRLAGHAYIARFEWVLDAIERDGYRVRPGYPERATLRGGLRIAADTVRSAAASRPGGREAAEPHAERRTREAFR